MGKKATEDKATLAEAYIHFQLEVKKKEIQDFQEEAIQLEAKKLRYTELREQLEEEQRGQMRVLRQQAREQERKLEQREALNKEQVELALQQSLDMARSQEADLAELHSELRRLEEQVLVLQAEKHIWLEYRNVGSQEHQRQIQQLETHLEDMQRGFQDMADKDKRALEVAFNEIDKKTAHLIDEKKHLAKQRAIKHLDKHSRQEIRENEWLKRELALYQKEVSLTTVAVQDLEEENLAHMTQLFEHRLENLQISRDVFLTQIAGLGPCDWTGQERTRERTRERARERARESGVPGCLVTETEDSGAAARHKALKGDEWACSCSATGQQPTDAVPGDLNVPLYGSQGPLQEGPVHLGRLEQTLLCVVGRALPLSTPSPEDWASQGCCGPAPPGLAQAPDDWPLTAHIIHNRFK